MDLDAMEKRLRTVERRLGEHEGALGDAGVRRQAGPQGFVPQQGGATEPSGSWPETYGVDEERMRLLVREEIDRVLDELGLTEEIPDDTGEAGDVEPGDLSAGTGETRPRKKGRRKKGG